MDTVGIKFPVEIDAVKKDMALVNIPESVKESIIIILLTKKGERMMHPHFGSRIHDFIFEPINFPTKELLRQEIIRCLTTFETRINNIEVAFTTINQGVLQVTITYYIISLNSFDETTFDLQMG